MTEPVKATRKFKADFDLVCRHFKCSPSEVEEMKICARADLPAAVQSYAIMAGEVAAC